MPRGLSSTSELLVQFHSAIRVKLKEERRSV